MVKLFNCPTVGKQLVPEGEALLSQSLGGKPLNKHLPSFFFLKSFISSQYWETLWKESHNIQYMPQIFSFISMEHEILFEIRFLISLLSYFCWLLIFSKFYIQWSDWKIKSLKDWKSPLYFRGYNGSCFNWRHEWLLCSQYLNAFYCPGGVFYGTGCEY